LQEKSPTISSGEADENYSFSKNILWNTQILAYPVFLEDAPYYYRIADNFLFKIQKRKVSGVIQKNYKQIHNREKIKKIKEQQLEFRKCYILVSYKIYESFKEDISRFLLKTLTKKKIEIFLISYFQNYIYCLCKFLNKNIRLHGSKRFCFNGIYPTM